MRRKLGCIILLAMCFLTVLGGCRAEPEVTQCTVPVLMYHHVADVGNGSTTVSTPRFEAQIKALADAGYTAVSVQEMIDFVYNGGSLPEKPVCITFDDGYESNLTLAAPILEKYGMTATVFCIGSSVGKDTYKDTGTPIYPHFSLEQAREYVDKGVISIQSHTYDMHQSVQLDQEPVRVSAIAFDGESDAEFSAALTDDCKKQAELFAAAGYAAPTVFAYPGGRYSEVSEQVLHGQGMLMTFTTDTDRENVLVRGVPESLYLLCRFNITDEQSPEVLLGLIG